MSDTTRTTEEIYGIKLNEIDPNAPSFSAYMPNYRPDYITWHCPTVMGDYNWGLYFTDWHDEAMAWHETCTLSTNINPGPAVIVRGPEAKKFLQKYLVNNFEKFPIGSSKHGIMCAENGKMLCNGVLMRTGEEEYEAHWLLPIINGFWQQEAGNYDAELEDITAKHFIFQLSGPRSLEVVEHACQEDLHDIEFNRIHDSSIDGMPVRVLRFGMTGGLGYEVHGDAADAKRIHLALVKAGNPYGLHLLGIKAYMMNHTLGGSVQMGAHYLCAMITDSFTAGSAGSAHEKLAMNPYETGLGRVINYSTHDFVGKEALLAYKARPESERRTMVSLEWNAEDIGEIYASQYRPGEEPVCPILTTGPAQMQSSAIRQEFDYVYDKDGKEIGISSGRTMSPYHNAMVSLCSLDIPEAEMGNEVFILWGDEGTRQMKVRAKVCPVPYNTDHDNKVFDVNTIPRLGK